MALGSSRAYLVKALYDWIVEGGEDPYIVVDCSYPAVAVPENHVDNGQIILNLAPASIARFIMGDSFIIFQARFGGIPTEINVPYGAISAIYGKQSGLGMAFGQEPGGVPEQPGEQNNAGQILGSIDSDDSRQLDAPKSLNRPNLRIVKLDDS